MRMVELGSVCEIKNGYAFKSSEFKKSGTPLIRISSFNNGAVYFDDKTVYLDSSYLKTKSGFKVEKGDVLIALSGATTGKYGIYTGDEPSLLNQRIGLLKSGASEQMNDKFFYYYLSVLKSEIIRNASGAAQPNISTKSISEFKIPLPPIDQQEKIAAILDESDAYRQKTKALIEKYDELTQSLFMDMFGDPVRNPMGWELLTFKDVLEIRNGKNQRTIENENGIYPICGSGGIMSYGDDFISEANSVIIGRKGNINKPILMKERYWHVDTAFGLNPIKTVLGHDYLYWFCVRYNFEQHNKTVTIPSLTKETLLRIKIPTPPIELQNQFAERVQAIEAQKAQAQASLAGAEDLFNSLLQRAFKGELTS